MPAPRPTAPPYELIERISAGATAEVFRARLVTADGDARLVAIKRLRPGQATDAESVRLFQREAEITARLHHPGTCRVLGSGCAEGTFYIALELVEGRDLGRVLEYHRIRGRTVPLSVALHVIGRICAALDHAHRATDTDGAPLGIVHQDVSPQNILVSYDGVVKLLDFGVARAGRAGEAPQLIEGKLPYLSPEQAAGASVDHRSDIFSCGTVLHELVTGQRLFAGGTPRATLERVRRARVEPLTRTFPRLPPAVDHILGRALARRPEHRYACAGDMVHDLDALATASGHTCTPEDLARWLRDLFGPAPAPSRET